MWMPRSMLARCVALSRQLRAKYRCVALSIRLAVATFEPVLPATHTSMPLSALRASLLFSRGHAPLTKGTRSSKEIKVYCSAASAHLTEEYAASRASASLHELVLCHQGGKVAGQRDGLGRCDQAAWVERGAALAQATQDLLEPVLLQQLPYRCKSHDKVSHLAASELERGGFCVPSISSMMPRATLKICSQFSRNSTSHTRNTTSIGKP